MECSNGSEPVNMIEGEWIAGFCDVGNCGEYNSICNSCILN